MDVQPSSNLTLAIKTAEPCHLDQILEIEQEAFSAPWTRGMFDAEIVGNPFSRLFVAMPIGEQGPHEGIVGYLCYWIVFEELRLLNLAVKPSWRRQGVARRFVQFALHDAGSQPIERALLEVRASNTAAQSLYDGFGFREYGSRAGYYTNPKEDAMLMRLEPLDLENPL
ncbi:MAG: ribosomal protein S18-alanine N-acetyltransferase [Nitrospirae bacterium]|nr:ribosomal protein S18-alanine N-acetyltransferase [Nitrospirota bacterium]MDA1305165.1 ribosomal protein S18-alanine N-acetyltransferase [Nitrospirota bacterium]